MRVLYSILLLSVLKWCRVCSQVCRERLIKNENEITVLAGKPKVRSFYEK